MIHQRHSLALSHLPHWRVARRCVLAVTGVTAHRTNRHSFWATIILAGYPLPKDGYLDEQETDR